MTEVTLVIAEKPDAARKIASALSPSARNLGNNAYDVSKAFDGKSYIILSASGHLFQVADSSLERAVFPVWDIDWFQSTGRSKPFKQPHNHHQLFQSRLRQISKMATTATDFVNACDYDIEGETIGANILQYACKEPTRILRAKFSTLTSEEIRNSFLNLKPAGDLLARAGRMRHEIDFLWGVNLSRLLTKAANNNSEQFSNVTIGRVQGPTLAFIVDREIQRLIHVPIPSWTLRCILRKGNTSFEANYSKSPVRNDKIARSVFEVVKDSEFAELSFVERSTLSIPPRYPFDLGELQKQAFYAFHMSPSRVLQAAEKLYLKALISYPRTDSQKLPPSIQPNRILQSLKNHMAYGDLVKSLLTELLKRNYPIQGPRDDPAHPAIYPTGEIPGATMSEEEKKLYEMIVRRFLNTFAPNVVVEKTTVHFDISSNEFESDWESLVEEGWRKYYPFNLPLYHTLEVSLEKGEKLQIENASMDEKYSAAPMRYNEASLLAKMESETIGTKATRADTISTLVARNYIRKSKELAPEERSMMLVHQLKQNCPKIVSSEMTRSLESKLDAFQAGKETEASIIATHLDAIRASLRSLIGMQELAWPTRAYHEKIRNTVLGNCPSCKEGTLIAIRSFRSKKRFIRCTNHQDGCKASSPLPPRGLIKTTKIRCESCGWPFILLAFSGGTRSAPSCSNFFCDSRKNNRTKSGH